MTSLKPFHCLLDGSRVPRYGGQTLLCLLRPRHGRDRPGASLKGGFSCFENHLPPLGCQPLQLHTRQHCAGSKARRAKNSNYALCVDFNARKRCAKTCWESPPEPYASQGEPGEEEVCDVVKVPSLLRYGMQSLL